jgi:hypothetical protein
MLPNERTTIMTGRPYEAPVLTEIGPVHELTLALNKIGQTPDIYSSTVPIVGDVVPAVS